MKRYWNFVPTKVVRGALTHQTSDHARWCGRIIHPQPFSFQTPKASRTQALPTDVPHGARAGNGQSSQAHRYLSRRPPGRANALYTLRNALRVEVVPPSYRRGSAGRLTRTIDDAKIVAVFHDPPEGTRRPSETPCALLAAEDDWFGPQRVPGHLYASSASQGWVPRRRAPRRDFTAPHPNYSWVMGPGLSPRPG